MSRGFQGVKFRPTNRTAFQTKVPPPAPATIPAPVGGWNARDPLASMNQLDAVVMDNIYPETASVRLRPGRVTWATGITGNIKTVMGYNSGTASKLFAASASGIWDVTAQAAVGAVAITATDGKFEYINVTTSGGSYLAAVNGVDKLKLFDGTTWTNIDAASTPAITGVATTDLIDIHLFKRRVWFIQKNTTDLWHLSVDSFAGAATKFPLGPVFSRGGKLIAMGSWTIDGGQGLDDYFVIVTSEGEAAVYQGTDPTAAATWALVGVYYVGKPIGRRCLKKYGGDLLYLSELGLTPMSKLLQSATIDRSQAVSDKIKQAYADAVQTYRSVFGWDIVINPVYNAVQINVPQVEASLSYQYIMNNLTKSWCRFTGWSADCFGEFGSDIYSGMGTKVYKNWIGTADDAVGISSRCQQAYFKAGSSQAQVELFRPNFTYAGSVTLQSAFDVDFDMFTMSPTQATYAYAATQALWGTGRWGTAVWSGTQTPSGKQWLSNPNNPGIFRSLRLQTTSTNATFNWVSTDYLLKGTGPL